MGKRSQITLFMILGLILVLSVVFLFYLASLVTESKLSDVNSLANKDASMVTSYVESCLELSAVNILLRYGYQGGEFDFDNPMWFRYNGENRLAYGLKYGYNLIPSIDEAEGRLELEMKKEVQKCIDFDVLRGYRINSSGADDIDVEIILGEDSTNVYMEYPVYIHGYDKKAAIVSDFQREIPLELSNYIVLAFNLVEQIKSSSTPFDLSLIDLSCNRIMACYGGDNILRIISYNSYADEPYYIYQFALEEDIVPTCTSMKNLDRGVC